MGTTSRELNSLFVVCLGKEFSEVDNDGGHRCKISLEKERVLGDVICHNVVPFVVHTDCCNLLSWAIGNILAHQCFSWLCRFKFDANRAASDTSLMSMSIPSPVDDGPSSQWHLLIPSCSSYQSRWKDSQSKTGNTMHGPLKSRHFSVVSSLLMSQN